MSQRPNSGGETEASQRDGTVGARPFNELSGHSACREGFQSLNPTLHSANSKYCPATPACKTQKGSGRAPVTIFGLVVTGENTAKGARGKGTMEWFRLHFVVCIMEPSISGLKTSRHQDLVSVIYPEAAGQINSHPPSHQTIPEIGFFLPLGLFG